jgi:Family of unknown function (DUF5677)
MNAFTAIQLLKIMPTLVQECGFFSDEAHDRSGAIRDRDKQLYLFHEALSRLVHQFRNGLPFEANNPTLTIAVALLGRALAAFEAMVFLAERGFGSETRTTCRNIMEVMFKLAYLLVKPDSAVILVGDSEQP